ncbi:type I-E CRISPR-associated protein Cse2/CasB [Glycomyces harbinensis]|uniref:CRISPR system Cascade subunit CasB n=1 Tax=Glycomyces harbinensis TaxID=58114 RepID=A0A1G6RJD3_9ACTN|nr:type I-E CRISPR-associated protein Cse2/CasB [Glycomyces harbinensis]SDD04523.1 CRISPR system Cascade subunit CasB [Glycomyces harbinensis]
MSDDRDTGKFWNRFDPDAFEASAKTAALRRGAGHEPGGIPAMWDFYTTWDLTKGGDAAGRFRAEHETLVLFGIHQQSTGARMHRRGMDVGRAAARLLAQESVGKQGLDALMNRIGGSTSQTELVGHLRRLVTMLKNHRIGLDYDRVYAAVWAWDDPSRRDGLCRNWGRQYKQPVDTPSEPSAPEQ